MISDLCRGSNRQRIWLIKSLWCLVLVLIGSQAVSGQVISAPPWPKVPAGIEYNHHRIGENPWSIHVLKVDRTKQEFRLVSSLAKKHIFDLAPLSEQIKQLSKESGEPVAGVNGDFFVIRQDPYRGDPLGLQIVEGELVSSPVKVSFWIDSKGQPHIGELTWRFQASGPDGLNIPFSVNQERSDDVAVLY
ncbi:MAG: phosphodiester glycosidase family protein, partial [Planctomycetes bacterium]|nr:phosphodiester glycosidase family protein [Planctomycetota bacterium]